MSKFKTGTFEKNSSTIESTLLCDVGLLLRLFINWPRFEFRHVYDFNSRLINPLIESDSECSATM